MAHTYRKDSRESKIVRDGQRTSHFWRKECKDVRTNHARNTRHETKRALEQEDYDNLPRYPHTSGWETN